MVRVWNVLRGSVVEAGCLTFFKKYWMSTWLITFRALGQMLEGGVRWEIRCF